MKIAIIKERLAYETRVAASPDVIKKLIGLGFEVTGDLGKSGELGSIGSYSWGGAFLTDYWIDPSENLIAVFMSQVRPSQSDIRVKFNTMVYQALE